MKLYWSAELLWLFLFPCSFVFSISRGYSHYPFLRYSYKLAHVDNLNMPLKVSSIRTHGTSRTKQEDKYKFFSCYNHPLYREHPKPMNI